MRRSTLVGMLGGAIVLLIGVYALLPSVEWTGMSYADLQIMVSAEATATAVDSAQVGYFLKKPDVSTLEQMALPLGYGWKSQTDASGKCQLRAVGGAGGSSRVFWKSGRVGPVGYVVVAREGFALKVEAVPDLLERSLGTRMVPLASKPTVEIKLQPRASDEATTLPSADGPIR